MNSETHKATTTAAADPARPPEEAALMADEWQSALGQLRQAMRAAAGTGAAGLLLLLMALALGGAVKWVIAVLGAVLVAGALGFMVTVHQRIDQDARGAIDEYRGALSLLASLQETSGAMGELLGAMRTTSVDGLLRIDRTITQVSNVVRRIPLISNPLTDLGLDAVAGVSRLVIDGADRAEQLARGLEEAVTSLDVTAMERQSKAVRQLAADLRQGVDGSAISRGGASRVGG
ncbi:MAG: hypothetical protein AAF184_16510 [Pseudomonadota bacterium]